MIQEAVKSIVEAEELSEREIAFAGQSRQKAIAEAEAEAEKIRAEGAASLKAYVAEKIAAAATKAEEQKNELIEEHRAVSDTLLKKYEKNKDKAVKAVLEKIV